MPPLNTQISVRGLIINISTVRINASAARLGNILIPVHYELRTMRTHDHRDIIMFDFELILRQSTRYAAMIKNSDTGGDCLGLSVEWAVNIMMGHSKTIDLPELGAGHATQRE